MHYDRNPNIDRSVPVLENWSAKMLDIERSVHGPKYPCSSLEPEETLRDQSSRWHLRLVLRWIMVTIVQCRMFLSIVVEKILSRNWVMVANNCLCSVDFVVRSTELVDRSRWRTTGINAWSPSNETRPCRHLFDERSRYLHQWCTGWPVHWVVSCSRESIHSSAVDDHHWISPRVSFERSDPIANHLRCSGNNWEEHKQVIPTKRRETSGPVEDDLRSPPNWSVHRMGRDERSYRLVSTFVNESSNQCEQNRD